MFRCYLNRNTDIYQMARLIAATAPAGSSEWQVRADDLDSYSRDFSSVAVCTQKA
jgi:hypothetical protein